MRLMVLLLMEVLEELLKVEKLVGNLRLRMLYVGWLLRRLGRMCEQKRAVHGPNMLELLLVLVLLLLMMLLLLLQQSERFLHHGLERK